MTNHNKLVRDKIPDIIRQNGETAIIRALSDDNEYLEALLVKDEEESAELRENPCLEELADKLEVLIAIGKVLGFTQADIESARIKKYIERGGFENRVFLEETT